MAWCKYSKAIKRSSTYAFDGLYRPDAQAPHAGIWQCQSCGREIGLAEGQKLPPPVHHRHAPSEGPVVWRLIVYADHRPTGEQV